MPAKSESASPLRRWRVPRWVLEAWLWGAVAFMVFDGFACRHSDWDGACTTIKNSAAILLYLFPTGLMLFVPQSAPPWVSWAVLMVCALGCHWLMRRFLPPKVQVLQAAVLAAVAWLANYGLFLLFLVDAAHRTTGRFFSPF